MEDTASARILLFTVLAALCGACLEEKSARGLDDTNGGDVLGELRETSKPDAMVEWLSDGDAADIAESAEVAVTDVKDKIDAAGPLEIHEVEEIAEVADPVNDVQESSGEDLTEEENGEALPPVKWSAGFCEGTPGEPDWVAVPGTGYGLLADCGGFHLEVAAMSPEIMKLRYAGPVPVWERSYAVVGEAAESMTFDLSLTEAGVMACTEALAVEITPDCLLRIRSLDGEVLLEDPPDGGFSVGDTTSQVTRRTPLSERFYGFGEKTGALDKRGRVLSFFNTDFPGYGTDHDPLYQSIPFFIGMRGVQAYGLFTDISTRLRMDMAASEADRYVVEAGHSTPGGVAFVQYVIKGPAISSVVERYTSLTGRSPLPPRWSLGYHQSRWGYTPDARVREVAAEFRARGLPADGIWLDIDYMDEYRSWTWDPVTFPDPSGLVTDLAESGFKLTGIIDPGLKLDPDWDIYAQGLEGEHYLKTPDGEVYVGEVWPGASVFPDFSRASTRAWWGSLVDRLTDHGVRGIWLDMNEPASFVSATDWTIPPEVIVDGDGMATTMASGHNVYALLEARATRAGLLQAVPDQRPFILTRAGYAGIQRYAAVWTGDVPSAMASMADTFTMLLGLGLSGVPFVGSDVGGWEGSATPEAFARWMGVGALSPFYRGHCQTSGQAQEPWSFGAEVEDISRRHLIDRYRLLPVFYQLFHEHLQSGAPILRPMVWDFQDDLATHTRGDQGMLGPWLLVAPVMNEGATSREIYLPAGRWFEWRSGASVDGPTIINPFTPLAALPIYVREGAILPRGPDVLWSDADPAAPLRLDVYPAAEETQQDLYEDEGDGFAYQSGGYALTSYRTQRLPSQILFAADGREGEWAPPERRLDLRIHRVDHAVTAVLLDGEALTALDPTSFDGATDGWWWDAQEHTLRISLDDLSAFELSIETDGTYDDTPALIQVPISVTVPLGTSTDATIHIASSVSDWQHQPLSWSADGTHATGSIEVLAGTWFEYKYTRGDWATVEKADDCAETSNRVAQATAHPGLQDTVARWADWCR